MSNRQPLRSLLDHHDPYSVSSRPLPDPSSISSRSRPNQNDLVTGGVKIRSSSDSSDREVIGCGHVAVGRWSRRDRVVIGCGQIMIGKWSSGGCFDRKEIGYRSRGNRDGLVLTDEKNCPDPTRSLHYRFPISWTSIPTKARSLPDGLTT